MKILENGVSALAERAVEQYVDVLGGWGDPGQLGDVSDRNMGGPGQPQGSEVFDVGLTVVPRRVAPEKVDECRRRHPRRVVTQLLEVVEDGLFWQLQAVVEEVVCAEHDGAALVEVETVGQHRVMAKRQKTMVHCLRDLAKCSADGWIAGRCHNCDGEQHGCSVVEVEEEGCAMRIGHSPGCSPGAAQL